jgi:DNA-binding transcriptional LysR family regulator
MQTPAALTVEQDRTLRMSSFNWNDLKYFLALVRVATPSRAAHKVGVDHTTIRRRIKKLETALQTRLFEPDDGRYVLTTEGERLLRTAEEIEVLAAGAEARNSINKEGLTGSVRVGAPDGLGSLFLAPRLANFSRDYPGLEIEFVAMSRVFNVSNREADIAILMIAPKHGRQVIRKLTDCRLYLHASPKYLATSPPIRSVSDLKFHRFIGYYQDMLFGNNLNYLPPDAPDNVMRFASTSMIAQYYAAVGGGGICLLPRYMTRDDDGLQRILEDDVAITREVWTTMHSDLRDIPRYRAVMDFIHEVVARNRHLFLE